MEHLIEYKEMREAIARVRELHKPSEEDYFGPVCIECDFGRYSCGCGGWVEWPCDTIKALDGEQ